MRARPRASKAQAQRLAGMFADADRFIRDGGYVDSTDRAILSRGWARPNGEVGFLPNSTVFRKCIVTTDGLRALAVYLAKVADDAA